MSSPGKIKIELTRNEALVLFEYLSRGEDNERYEVIDQAEERVLWNLQGVLQRQLVEPFDPNYKTLIKAARDALRDVGDSPHDPQ